MSGSDVGGPVWHTERLSLRCPSVDDVDDVFCLLQDSLATLHNPSDALTDRDQAAALVERWRHHWDDHGIGYCAVSWRDDTAVLGLCGVKVMALHERQAFNLLYRLSPPVWGRGVATEAATELVRDSPARAPSRALSQADPSVVSTPIWAFSTASPTSACCTGACGDIPPNM